jgi:hypothetical protein
MSEPVVFISHFGLKEGKLEAFRQYFREGASLLIYGTPSASVLDMMRRGAESQRADFSIKPEHLGGFIRLTSDGQPP